MEWQKHNKEIIQITTSKCIHYLVISKHDMLFNTSELKFVHPLCLPILHISVLQDRVKSLPKKGGGEGGEGEEYRKRGRCQTSRCSGGTGIFSTDSLLPRTMPMAQPHHLRQSVKLPFLPTERPEQQSDTVLKPQEVRSGLTQALE